MCGLSSMPSGHGALRLVRAARPDAQAPGSRSRNTAFPPLTARPPLPDLSRMGHTRTAASEIGTMKRRCWARGRLDDFPWHGSVLRTPAVEEYAPNWRCCPLSWSPRCAIRCLRPRWRDNSGMAAAIAWPGAMAFERSGRGMSQTCSPTSSTGIFRSSGSKGIAVAPPAGSAPAWPPRGSGFRAVRTAVFQGSTLSNVSVYGTGCSRASTKQRG